MEKCTPRGRDCIERFSTSTFNCSVTCEGIFADTVRSNIDNQDSEQIDQEKYQRLLTEYKNLKRKTCKHYRFNSNMTKYSKFRSFINFLTMIWKLRRGAARIHPSVGANLLWHGHLWRHREGQEDQDGGPAESHWRHYGTSDWVLDHQRCWDRFLSFQIDQLHQDSESSVGSQKNVFKRQNCRTTKPRIIALTLNIKINLNTQLIFIIPFQIFSLTL